MKTIKFLVIAVLALSVNIACSSQANKEEDTTAAETVKVEVFYFHYTRRCATCIAVQNVSKDAIADLYQDRVNYADYNLEEKAGAAKGKELSVSGQTLLIVSGDAKINITNEAFMNARSNPDKLKQIIKQKIDPLL